MSSFFLDAVHHSHHPYIAEYIGETAFAAGSEIENWSPHSADTILTDEESTYSGGEGSFRSPDPMFSLFAEYYSPISNNLHYNSQTPNLESIYPQGPLGESLNSVNLIHEQYERPSKEGFHYAPQNEQIFYHQPLDDFSNDVMLPFPFPPLATKNQDDCSIFEGFQLSLSFPLPFQGEGHKGSRDGNDGNMDPNSMKTPTYPTAGSSRRPSRSASARARPPYSTRVTPTAPFPTAKVKCTVPGCDKQFTRSTDMKRHVQTASIHRSEATVDSLALANRCEKCGDDLSRDDSRKRHGDRNACLKRRRRRRVTGLLPATVENLRQLC